MKEVVKKYGIWVMLLSMIALYFLLTELENVASYLYPSFGIQTPYGYNTHGIDVSHYQQKINWKEVSEMNSGGKKISFAFMKATEGCWLKDKHFERNWKESKKYNLLRGAYLFYKPNTSGKKQADFFIKNLKLEKGDFAPVVDVEDIPRGNKENFIKELKNCLSILEKTYKVKPIIYSNADYYNKYLSEFENYPLWVAHYVKALKPNIDRDWHIWQYSDCGKSNGICCNVDFNVAKSSLWDLKNLCLKE
ncbi:MAG: glycoside hydrolase family 25 protein [Chitinophagaceae bacterium]|nr:glycoside hydrolase family 25 protein [Chitinophagaceae bacterium]